MYQEDFVKRLIELRTKKGVSARDMSLSLGQNPGYINNIESGKALPSMSGFFYMCEYFDITPSAFFDFSKRNAQEQAILLSYVAKLNEHQIDLLIDVANNMTPKNK